MTAVGIPIKYDGPAVTRPQVSLLGSAEVVTHTDERFTGGIDITYETCSDDHIGIWEYCVDNPEPKPVGPLSSQATFQPFTITAGITCSTFSGYSAEDFLVKADRKLKANISQKIENELWTGAVLGNDAIASSDANEVTSSAIAPGKAVARLEDALGGRGTIHMSPLVLGILLDSGSNAVFSERDPQTGNIRYFTFMGNPIVAGYGYPGTDPDGQAAATDTSWVYATSPVVVHIGAVNHPAETITQGVSRGTNDVTFYAEQTAIATFDISCGHHAAQVSTA